MSKKLKIFAGIEPVNAVPSTFCTELNRKLEALL